LEQSSDLSNAQIEKLFEFLSEQRPSAVPKQGQYFLDLIRQRAVDFKSRVNLLSLADAAKLDQKIRRDLIVLADSNFVNIAAGGILSFPDHRLHSGFLSDLCFAMKQLSDSAIDPFGTFVPMGATQKKLAKEHGAT